MSLLYPQRARAGLRLAACAAAAALALGLSACDRNDERTPGQQLDAAIAKTEQAAQQAKQRTQEAAQDAKERAREAAAQTRARADAMAEDTREKLQTAGQQASASTEAVAANARAAVEDAGITARVNAALAKDAELEAARIDVDTQGGVVTLSGPAKNAQARERATQIARGVEGVRSVVNNLTLVPGS